MPDSFRIARQLLNRIEDEKTGRVLVEEYQVTIPPARLKEAETAAVILKDSIRAEFPFVEGARPASDDIAELILNRDWRPALSIIGADGLPQIGNAGNVLRPIDDAEAVATDSARMRSEAGESQYERDPGKGSALWRESEFQQ